MQDFSCAAALLVVERGVVDQEVGAPDQRGDPGLILDGPRISGVDDLPPRTRLAQHVAGPNLGLDAVADDANRLPALEPTEERARRDTERDRSVTVESPGRSSSSRT